MSTNDSPFDLGNGSTSRPEDPESVFGDLRPRDGSVKHLWSHQADILRKYHQECADCSDVALELPTGMGKTLVGLLAGEYRRLAHDERVLYLCPTKQLARQVARQAEAYGIGAVLLIGPQRAYPVTDHARYAQSDAIAITTYSAVFNTSPRLDDGNVLILDDAHAGGDYVADLWSLNIPREHSAFRPLVQLFADTVPHAFLMRLLSDDVDPVERFDVQKIWSAAYLDRLRSVVELLNAHATDDTKYAWRMIQDHLEATHCYLSWSNVLIRPIIPPTMRHAPFADARQRIYMSATLGAGGELERVMGIEQIARVPVPENWEAQRTGRRFILFPSFLGQTDVDQLMVACVARTDRTLVLCPTNHHVAQTRSQMAAADGVEVLDSSAIEESLDAFAEHEHAVLVLAGRYDGLDLPDAACRLLILVGLPSALNQQERFFTDNLRLDAVFRDRIRTRITQGVGRCTRNPGDYAAVLLSGTDLLSFCLRKENVRGMPRELQAELRFGLQNSVVGDIDGFLVLLDTFLAQDDTWAKADARIREMRKECEQEPDPLSKQLMDVAPAEGRYAYALWDGDYRTALECAKGITDGLAGDPLRNYRAWWYYLAAAAALLMRRADDDKTVDPLIHELSERAKRAATTSWLRGVGIGRAVRLEPDDLALVAAENLARTLERLGLAGQRFESHVGNVVHQLSERSADSFEAGMEALGELLGFDSFRPGGKGTPDCIWRLDGGPVVVWEVKSQAEDDTEISVATARQCVGHLGTARADLDLDDADECYVVLACHRLEIDATAVPQIDDTRVVPIGTVRALADLAADTLRRARARAADSSDVTSIVAEELARSGIQPQEVIRKITATKAKNLPTC